jgi:phage FluMu protein Com
MSKYTAPSDYDYWDEGQHYGPPVKCAVFQCPNDVDAPAINHLCYACRCKAMDQIAAEHTAQIRKSA